MFAMVVTILVEVKTLGEMNGCKLDVLLDCVESRAQKGNCVEIFQAVRLMEKTCIEERGVNFEPSFIFAVLKHSMLIKLFA